MFSRYFSLQCETCVVRPYISEMKTSRAALERHVALPGDQFDAFFSFPTSKRGGYSGVGVFSNTETSIPLKAEEGLTGLLNTSSSGSKSVNAQISDDSSRVSRPVGYPRAGDEGLVLLPFTPEVEGTDTPTFGLSKLTAQDEFVSLDAEGRSLVLDYGLFASSSTFIVRTQTMVPADTRTR